MAMVTADVESKQAWNPFDPQSKPTVLRVVREEAEGMFALVDDPDNWEQGTAAGHWQARDIIGHMVDVTEAYLERFSAAREGREIGTIGTLTGMARMLDEHATALRSVPRADLIARLRDDFERLMRVFEDLTADEWGSLIVTHGYMGPLPAFFYPTFQLVDYSIHSWDIREGLREPQLISADAADLLVPIMPILLQATFDPGRLDRDTFQVGLRVSGRNAQTLRLTASPDGFRSEAGDVDDLPSCLEFDPASFVLTAYGRIRGGTACGDRRMASHFSGLFFAI